MSALTAKQREQWEQFGWISLPGLVVDLVDELDTWARRIERWALDGGPGLHHFEQTDHGPRVARSEDFMPHLPPMASFLRQSPITEVLEELFGEPAVLFKEKINYKHSGGAGFAPHQDAPAYRFAEHHISALVPLDPSTVERGALFFAPGHRQGLIAHTDGRIDPEWVASADWRPVEAFPGDVVVFDSYAPHYSDTNRTSSSRRSLYLTYNAASLGDLRTRYYEHKAELLQQVAADPGSGERVRVSVSDDFLGRPVT